MSVIPYSSVPHQNAFLMDNTRFHSDPTCASKHYCPIKCSNGVRIICAKVLRSYDDVGREIPTPMLLVDTDLGEGIFRQDLRAISDDRHLAEPTIEKGSCRKERETKPRRAVAMWRVHARALSQTLARRPDCLSSQSAMNSKKSRPPHIF